MDVTFSERDTGPNWTADVLHGGLHVGTIRLSEDLTAFRYFEGPDNDFTYSMDDHDLKTLKARITAAIARPRPRPSTDWFER